MAEVSIPVHYTYTPSDLIPYLNSGGQQGVENILSDIIAQELRTWSVGDGLPDDYDPENLEEGYENLEPRESWEDVVRAGDNAVDILIRAVCRAGGLEGITNEQIKSVRNGSVTISIPNLGVNLNRLNVGEIEPTGELAKAAELRAKEKRDQEAEEIELAHIRKQTDMLVNAGMSREQAVELIQTERQKVTKTVDRKDFGVAPETRGSLEQILAGAVSAFANRGGSDITTEGDSDE